MKTLPYPRSLSFLFFTLALLLGAGLAQAAGKGDLVGHWKYASGESEGSTTSVYGDLKLGDDGRFEDNRRIGGIGGFRKGTYAVSGSQLNLTCDGGKNTQAYAVSFGTAQDKTGKTVRTLLLKGKGLSFLLTRKE